METKGWSTELYSDKNWSKSIIDDAELVVTAVPLILCLDWDCHQNWKGNISSIFDCNFEKIFEIPVQLSYFTPWLYSLDRVACTRIRMQFKEIQIIVCDSDW